MRSSTYPQEVRDMDAGDRSTILAKHNLEVTQSELAKCREAIRNGSIWQLAEKRSHSSPYLREAFSGCRSSWKSRMTDLLGIQCFE